VSASWLVLASFGHLRGWWALSPRALQYGRAVLLLYLLRLLWQCYFFLRTDFYYAISNFLGCTSLMRDTRVWLRDVLARRLGLGKGQDQSDLPARERRMVRVYAVVWLSGRSLAIATLLLVQLPLLVQYAMLLGRTLGGQAAPAAETAPRLLAGLFFTTLLLTGFGLWLRQLWLGRGETA
jgi:putative peptide zinc metalloprotease protein